MWKPRCSALWAVMALVASLSAGPARAAPFAYVANVSSNNVSVIDTATNTVVATVPVGKHPDGVAVSPDGKHAYVTNFASDSVSVIGTLTNTVEATVPVGVQPFGISVTPDGQHVYVANYGANSVSVIATATNEVVDTVTMGLNGPSGVAVSPDGKHAYVTNSEIPNSVSVIDTALNKLVTTVSLVGGPGGARRHPGRKTRLCRDFLRQPDFGDRHRRQQSGCHGPGGEYSRWNSVHSRRKTRLCFEL